MPRSPSPVRDGVPAVRRDRVLTTHLRVVRELGKGGFGVALLCHSTATPLRMRPGSPVRGPSPLPNGVTFPECVVVKLTRLDGLPAADRAAVLAEAATLRKLTHPNVVQCLDCWIEDSPGPHRGYLAIAMPFCENGDLARLIANHRGAGAAIPVHDVVNITGQVAEALAYVHGLKILHRDVKPGNVFLRESGHTAVLGDFGVARQLDFTAQRAQTYVGTPQYMPPEVLRGEPYGSAADMWGLGVLLYELMCGKRPFDAKGLPRVQVAIERDDPIPQLRTAATSVYGTELVDVVEGLLRKAPEARPTAQQLLQTLEKLGHERPPARPSTPVRKSTASPLRAGSRSPVRDAERPSFPRVARLAVLRDSVLVKARGTLREESGARLHQALGSARLLALIETTVAIYAPDSTDRALDAVHNVLRGFPTTQPAEACLELVKAHYFLS